MYIPAFTQELLDGASQYSWESVDHDALALGVLPTTLGILRCLSWGSRFTLVYEPSLNIRTGLMKIPRAPGVLPNNLKTPSMVKQPVTRPLTFTLVSVVFA